jgi:hypothetical protein
MKTVPSLFLCGAMLALSACSAANRSADSTGTPAAAVGAPAQATPPASPPTSTPAEPAATAAETQAGWYMEHGDGGTFQPCGQDKALTVDSEELRQRARDFGLEPDTPVYVRLSGASDGSTFTVARVDQFGSPEPVRDCRMTGTVTQ